jgi:hypothetical protein
MSSRAVSAFAIVVLLVVLIWDAYLAARSSRDTMSNIISNLNTTTGGLLALAIAALWVHWFIPLPHQWMSTEFDEPRA